MQHYSGYLMARIVALSVLGYLAVRWISNSKTIIDFQRLLGNLLVCKAVQHSCKTAFTQHQAECFVLTTQMETPEQLLVLTLMKNQTSVAYYIWNFAGIRADYRNTTCHCLDQYATELLLPKGPTLRGENQHVEDVHDLRYLVVLPSRKNYQLGVELSTATPHLLFQSALTR